MILFRLLFLLPLLTGCLFPPSSRNDTVVQQGLTMDEVHSELDYVKYEQSNVSAELSMFEGRLGTQEELLSASRRELADAQVRNQERLLRDLTDFSDRLSVIESGHTTIIDSLRDLKTHANDVGASLGQAKQRMNSVEKSLDSQQETVRNLEGALRALMALVDSSEAAPEGLSQGAQVYKVKSGDTLERIARREGTTVQALKHENNISDDLIRVNQTLHIPK